MEPVNLWKKENGETARLPEPKPGENVWPGQVCPLCSMRRRGFGVCPECWYCRYADFHLDCDKALEVGICRYPKQQID